MVDVPPSPTRHQVLSEAECGSAADKLRLFLIQYLCGSLTPGASDADEAAMLLALQEAGADTRPIAYMKQWKSIMKVRLQSFRRLYTHMKLTRILVSKCLS